MLMIRTLLLVMMLVAAMADPNAAKAESGNIEQREFVCMAQDTVMLKPGIPIEHEGKTYWGCCANCVQTIKTQPEQLTLATDPVTGATVDKAKAFIYNLNGFAVYFASQSSREIFGRDPRRYITQE